MNVGIVGLGFMGWIHYLAYQQLQDVTLRAICTRDPKKRAGDWTGIKGNFGPPGRQVDLAGVACYADLDEMLADPAIDVVDICLPPALHPAAAVAAFKAGKHVIVEKPLALSVKEGQAMAKAARASGKQLYVAHVLPYFAPYAFALEAARKKKYGRLLGGHFKRIISEPLWIKDFFQPRGAGGPVIDLHVHDAHFIRLLFGQPRAVFSTGRKRGKVVEFVNTQFLYGPTGPQVTAASGVIRQQGRGFTHAFELYFARATLLFDLAVIGDAAVTAMPLTVLTDDGQVHRPELPAGGDIDAFAAELGEALRAAKKNKPSPTLSGALALDALTLCQRQIESVEKGKLVKV